MINFNGQSYDERELSIEAKYYLKRDYELRHASEKAYTEFVDAQLFCEALASLSARNSEQLVAEMAKMQPLEMPGEAPVDEVVVVI